MSKTKIEIKSVMGSVLFSYESKDNTFKKTVEQAVSEGADPCGANLRGANLKKLPQDYINQCSRDILFILEHLKTEVPGLRKALVDGKVDGSQYEGDCACLIGTLANVDGGMKKVCEAIPFYEKGTHNMGEAFFLNIREGDTPKNNSFAAHAIKLCDLVCPPKKSKAKNARDWRFNKVKKEI